MPADAEADIQRRLYSSLQSLPTVSGLTHEFYRYPARFPATFAREVIHQFSQVGDCILDPFMGGGTAIVEAVASGRSAIGVDINSLAHFITTVKTTPLHPRDKDAIFQWAQYFETVGDIDTELETPAAQVYLRNLPDPVKRFFAYAARSLELLHHPRQRRFAQCALLRLGQRAIDCKEAIPPMRQLKEDLVRHVEEMFTGMDDFVRTCAEHGIRKSAIVWLRWLRRSPAANIPHAEPIGWQRPKLVITSPPYPGVHVLYHRWQVKGRRETPAPYWIAALNDGRGASYYTFGSRSHLGLMRYFRMLTASFRSIRKIIHPEALIIQLVSFSNLETQLPLFLRAMDQAGYYECFSLSNKFSSRIWRLIPHRKWYTQLTDLRSDQLIWGRQEVLLFHRPA